MKVVSHPMTRFWPALLPVALLAALALRTTPAVPVPASVAPPADRDRSPYGLALTRDGRNALTANVTSDSVSLVDLTAGKVASEATVGQRPFAVALTPDGRTALVTNSWGNSVTLLEVGADGLGVTATVPVGDEPRGVAVTADGGRAFVALAGEDRVAVLDLKTRKVTARWSVGVEPWHVAISPDGKTLAVANTRGRTVSVLDAKTGAERHTVKTQGRNLRQIAISADGQWAYLPSIAERGAGVSIENVDRGWIVGNRLTRVPLTEDGPREAITLDRSRDAVADLDGCAFSPDGQTIALTAGGTHELLLLRTSGLPFVAYGGPGDHIDESLAENSKRFRRVKLGGRPLGVAFTPDGKTVVVTNYLSNAVQTVDTANGQVVKTIALGGPASPSLERRGEAIFHDGNRSFGSWYSCNSCHTEGHTNGGNFDTLNDGGIGKPKRTPSLRGLSETAPYTWHGWNPDLRDSVKESMRKTMQASSPTDADVDALTAYLKTLTFRPNPNRAADGSLTPAARRGETVFTEKGCVSCHSAPLYTTPKVYTVGLEQPDDVYQGFNPPTLRGVYARSPYLHDGRARTLEDVLTVHHRPSQLTGKPDLNPSELADVIAFLKSL